MKSFVAALIATAVMGQTTDPCATLKTAWDNAAAADKTSKQAEYDTCVKKAACDVLQSGYNTAKSNSATNS